MGQAVSLNAGAAEVDEAEDVIWDEIVVGDGAEDEDMTDVVEEWLDEGLDVAVEEKVLGDVEDVDRLDEVAVDIEGREVEEDKLALLQNTLTSFHSRQRFPGSTLTYYSSDWQPNHHRVLPQLHSRQ